MIISDQLTYTFIPFTWFKSYSEKCRKQTNVLGSSAN